MKQLSIVLLFYFYIQSIHVTVAESDSLLVIEDGPKSRLRFLQGEINDTATDAPTQASSMITDSPTNGTEIPTALSIDPNTTNSSTQTNDPSSETTSTLEPTTYEAEGPETETSSGLQTTDIALIVVGLLGIGFLVFGVGGSYLSGSKTALSSAAPAPISTSEGVEIAEA